MFNSLKYAKLLEDTGLPRNQAEVHIQIISEVIGEEMATRQDIIDIRNDFKVLVEAYRKDFNHLNQNLEAFMGSSKQDLESFKDSSREDLETFQNSSRKDLKAFQDSSKKDFESFRDSSKNDLEAFKDSSKKDLENLEYRIVVKLCAFITILLTTALTVNQLLA